MSRKVQADPLRFPPPRWTPTDEARERMDPLTLPFARKAPQEPSSSPHPPLAFKRIVVAYDAERASRYAVHWGRELGRRFGSKVWVLNIVTPQYVFDSYHEVAGPVSPVEVSFRDQERRADEIVRAAAGRISKAGLDVEAALRYGSPATEIVKFAKKNQADLVILGSHSRRQLERVLLGSVADAVKNQAESNVLITRTLPPPDRVLVATDGSTVSRFAEAMGIRLAHLWGAPARVVRVLEMDEAFLRPRKEEIANVTAGPEKARYDSVLASYEVLVGRAAKAVLQEAVRRDAGLIVVGTRGLTGLRALMSGSVSNRVAHNARSSVLVARGLGGRRSASPQASAGLAELRGE